ncbi:unnamed protein product [Protopolystoma xenopodis]|uniref:Uncharacterized protein n=1 Tax=Protopolystoma xenopodis TaxID=117903 RepID=A0A3S5FFT8_9PLAT|nr:unnamed protein product [Protopolystoma xenopodis]
MDTLSLSVSFEATFNRSTLAQACLCSKAQLGQSTRRYRVSSICDIGVYTRNRNFRLPGSQKSGKANYLLPLYDGLPMVPVEASIKSATTKCISGDSGLDYLACYWPNWRSWAENLVTYLGPGATLKSPMLLRPVPGCKCAIGVSASPLDTIYLDAFNQSSINDQPTVSYSPSQNHLVPISIGVENLKLALNEPNSSSQASLHKEIQGPHYPIPGFFKNTSPDYSVNGKRLPASWLQQVENSALAACVDAVIKDLFKRQNPLSLAPG